MEQPTGYCLNPSCKAPLHNNRKYCDRLCCNRASSQQYRLRHKDKPAQPQTTTCTCVLPSYGVCIKHLNEKRRAAYKANKKYYPGSKLAIPHASFPGR